MRDGGILVTGGAGQLATALASLGGRAVRVVGRPAFDFDRPETLAEVMDAQGPALVVNAAAWTAVDAAEADEAGAARANATGPARLAELCAQSGAHLIHLSTDYVFDGSKGAPYVETDPVGPTGAYGRTKLEGERLVMQAAPRAVILRTSWVYSDTGRNFVRTMLKLAETRDTIRVVADQQGCPTSADELARIVLGVAAAIEQGWRDEFAGIFHSAGEGATSWHGFAEAIFDLSAGSGGKRPAVTPIGTAEYPTPARRPADSRLDCGKLARVFGLRQAPWQDSLARVMDRLASRAPA